MNDNEARALLNVVKEFKADYYALLDHFVRCSNRTRELWPFKSILSRSELRAQLPQLLKARLPEIPTRRRMKRAQGLADEYEIGKTELETVVGKLMQLNIQQLVPLGHYLKVGRPNDFSTLNRDERAGAEIAHSLRVFYDSLLLLAPQLAEGKKTSNAKRGARVYYDPVADAKIFSAWRTGRYSTFANCANALGRGYTQRSVSLAVDRHEKRLRKQAVNSR